MGDTTMLYISSVCGGGIFGASITATFGAPTWLEILGTVVFAGVGFYSARTITKRTEDDNG